MNFRERRVTLEGKEVRLTPKEFEVLQYLAHHPDKPLPHRETLGAVRGTEWRDKSRQRRIRRSDSLLVDASLPPSPQEDFRAWCLSHTRLS
jgi:DNA-binding response OmpR family regulator